jgi:hypothetical protein
MREASLADLETICGWLERDSGSSDEAVVQAVLHDPLSAVLIDGEGGAIFVWKGPGIFEVHLALSQRGREAIETLNGMFAHMRRYRGARLMWAAVPWDGSKQSRKVRLFARAMGWKSEGRAMTASGFCELFSSEK